MTTSESLVLYVFFFFFLHLLSLTPFSSTSPDVVQFPINKHLGIASPLIMATYMIYI